MPQAAKPAISSGPGAMSRRTDGGPASKQAIRYAAGEPGAEDFVNLQRQAPMAKAEQAKPMSSSDIAASAQQGGQGQAMQQQGPQAIPLGAPSQRPNEPVTNGAAAGPGAGPEALVLPKPIDPRQQEVQNIITKYLPDLQAATNIPGVPDSYRSFVNYLTRQVK